MKKSYKQIILMMLILVLTLSVSIFGVCNVSAKEDDYGCRSAFAELYRTEIKNASEDEFWVEYTTKNYYYNPTSIEASPDFVLVYCCNGVSFSVRSIILGEHIVRVAGETSPYPLGIYVYTPINGKIYTLSEAYMNDIRGVRTMVENCDVEYASVQRIGDVDKDGKLNVKDATLIQKKLAGIVELDDLVIGGVGADDYSTGICYSHADFNRDEKVNIRDATAIQKYIAGINV